MSICKVRGQLVKGPFSEEHSGHSSNFLIETAKSCASRLGKELSKQDYTASVPLGAAVGSWALLLGMSPADQGVTCNWREASSCPLLWALLSWTLVHCAWALCSSSLILECGGEERALLCPECPTSPSAQETPPPLAQTTAARPGAERLQCR